MHAERGSVAVVDAAGFSEPDTGTAADALESWGSYSPILVLLSGDEATCAKSFRNIPDVNVLEARDAGVADVIGAASLVVSPAALEALVQRTGEKS